MWYFIITYLVIIYSNFLDVFWLWYWCSSPQHKHVSYNFKKNEAPETLCYLWHSMRASFCGNPNPNSQVELWMHVKHLTLPGITWMIWDMHFYFKWINDLEELEWRKGNIKPNQNKNFSQTLAVVYNNSSTLLSCSPSVSHTPQWEDRNYHLRINFKTASWKGFLEDNDLHIEADKSDLNRISKAWDIYYF